METIYLIVLIIGITAGLVITIYYSYQVSPFDKPAEKEHKYDIILIGFSIFGVSLTGALLFVADNIAPEGSEYFSHLAALPISLIVITIVLRISIFIIRSFLKKNDQKNAE